ncbi:MAG: hypothetical protein KGL35_21925 [Bradyrhizobium sp.]|uniref:hypothetical protein n=1 Tax=Bradyrhizobium sp. TaxID=376 RepID=UPI001C28E050|nr:hypothetical protein [Bradyrhizobium sp.]MBU6463236.1 hypothetical protein [Pseudomonadota bacterium]MDE2068106.1 hypothetical protein [Bradyrhizobium sp.]MDE2471315.1 hypothetical protein [Bradyrhizobium sp.]
MSKYKFLLMLFILAVGSPSLARNPEDQRTSPTGVSALVGERSVQVIGANISRRGIVFFNDSADHTIWIVPANQPAARGRGIPILPGGEQWFIGEGYRFTSGWNAATDAAEVPIEILELF